MKAWLQDVISFLNGFRKWSIMIILVILGAGFRIAGLISGQEMVELLSSTGIAFLSANSVEHMASAITEWVKTKAK